MAAEECNTGLSLGLGLGEYAAARNERRPKDNNKYAAEAAANRACCIDLSFKLCPNNSEDADGDGDDVDHNKLIGGSSLETGEEDGGFGIKSYELNNNFSNNNNNNNNNNNICSRKKLRLTIEQSSLLEDSFKLHTTLNSSQKQALAERLNLKPRQVEVWFQNRRARTKLKQTVVDCEFLRKCCENLTDENKRLKKELQELQSMKAGGASSPLFIQLQKARRCPSCDKIVRNKY